MHPATTPKKRRKVRCNRASWRRGQVLLESSVALRARSVEAVVSQARVEPVTIVKLPNRLRAAHGLFEKTGGLHAAALFDLAGNLLAVREDVGRHNALDKLIGWAFLQKRLPLDERIIMVSGRASRE
jgi:FdhD protein